jgi:hypothetical protein
MIDQLAAFCAGVGHQATVTLTPYHFPERQDEVGGEAPLWGRCNGFVLLVERWDGRQRTAWMQAIQARLFDEGRLFWTVLGQEAAKRLDRVVSA